MFDVTRSKVLSRNNRFQEYYNVKYFKEIKCLKSLQKAEAYLEPKRGSTVELFVNILNGLLFSIKDVRLGYTDLRKKSS